MADSVSNETQVDRSSPPSEPHAAGDEWAVLGKLSERERTFVRHALYGKDLGECAKLAGWTGEDGPARLLGRPNVREALEQLAPLFLPVDPRRVARLLSAYWGKKLIDTALRGSDAQSTAAIKELEQLAGLNTSKVEHLHASLADILTAIEQRRQLGGKEPGPQPKQLVESTAVEVPSSDAESVGSLDSIWDRGLSGVSPTALDSPPAAKKEGTGKRRGRRPRKAPGT